jgi:hypothetical protein
MRLLILLLLFALSFSQHVKVLYSNGKVEVVDTRKTPLSVLRARPDVIYVEPPIKLKLLDDHSLLLLRSHKGQWELQL